MKAFVSSRKFCYDKADNSRQEVAPRGTTGSLEKVNLE